MPATIRIKRRAAGGAAGAPATLAAAELAFNEQDNTLYYGKGDNGTGIATSVVAIGGSGTFPSTSTSNTWAGANNFTGGVTLGGATSVTGTINFNGATVQNFPLDKLSDVNIGKTIALANGHMIAWDGADWVNIPAPSGGGGGTLTSVSAGANTGIDVATVGGAVTVSGLDASTTAKGVVQLADAAAITAGTALRVVDAAQLKAAAYTLPTASATVLGGVKVGTNLTIDGTGVLSATVPGALIYKGDADVTVAAPATPASGDVYRNSKAGTAHPSWNGVTGVVSKDALLIYDGAKWSTADLASAAIASLSPTAPITVDATDPVNPVIGVSAATAAANGVVRLADAAAIAGGTAGRVVDAAQLKVVNDRLPAGTAADEMLKWDAAGSAWVVTATIDCGVF